MRVDAVFAVVIVVLIRAPDRLEMVNVEVHVDRILLDQLHTQFVPVVSEGAKLPIFTLFDARSRLAKLRLVLVRVVELFKSIVSVLALVADRAFALVFSCQILAHLRTVGA